MRVMGVGIRGPAAILGVVFVAGCSSAFERSFDAGNYDEVVARFEADSALHNDPDAMFRAALAYATPDHPSYDPARARDLLDELLRRFPGSSDHREAVALFTSLESSERLARDGERIETELHELRGRVAELERRLSEQEVLHAEIANSNVALRDSLARTQRLLRVREGQMRALQDELGALKRIDLAPVTDTTGT
ncbi:MAG: tetratricopeptide repeat protein [Longimicrobiales bacterium]